jgi:phospholipase C
MTKKLLAAFSLAATMLGPVASSVAAAPAGRPHAARAPRTDAAARAPRTDVASPHVIVMIQENRTVDNLFQGFPGADAQPWGLDSHGRRVALHAIGLRGGFDPDHSHSAFVTEYDRGKMDGFGLQSPTCFPTAPGCTPTVYAYVPGRETVAYRQLARQFALADHVLSPNEGPSFPAHQYLIAGQSGYPLAFSENPPLTSGTCAASNALVTRIDMTSPYPGVEANPAAPCADYLTVLDLLDAAGVSWKYYAPSANGIWTAPLAVKHIFQSQDAQKVVVPETAILSDIANNVLPQVSYVVPGAAFSDHPEPGATGRGPDWVGVVANAIGTNAAYWGNTTLIVVWDDWGGWYDHYAPVHPSPGDPYEYGFRVPMIVVSAYVVPHQVDHSVRSAASILSFIESTFALRSLGTLDARSDDLSGMFDFTQLPNAYVPVNTHGWTSSIVRRLAPDRTPPDW